MGSPVNTRTKKVLIGAAAGLFVWELLAVFGEEQFITDALVELALDRVWIFWWIGAILGHLTLPLKPAPLNSKQMTERFVIAGLVFVVAWELLLGFAGHVVEPVLELYRVHLWAAVGLGYLMGSRLWPRKVLEVER